MNEHQITAPTLGFTSCLFERNSISHMYKIEASIRSASLTSRSLSSTVSERRITPLTCFDRDKAEGVCRQREGGAPDPHPGQRDQAGVRNSAQVPLFVL